MGMGSRATSQCRYISPCYPLDAISHSNRLVRIVDHKLPESVGLLGPLDSAWTWNPKVGVAMQSRPTGLTIPDPADPPKRDKERTQAACHQRCCQTRPTSPCRLTMKFLHVQQVFARSLCIATVHSAQAHPQDRDLLKNS